MGGNFLKVFWDDRKYTIQGTHLNNAAPLTAYFNTTDPSDPENFDVAAFDPDLIVHAGAMTHVDACEDQPAQSHLHTVSSTENMVDLARTCGAKMIYISTDYVFDGEDGPYTEEASPNPQSIYGEHKLEAEQKISSALNDYLILRITNVYGEERQGKNFILRLINNLLKGAVDELPLPFDQYATPINAFDVARAAKKLVENDHQGIFHLGSTDYMNRCQLASRVLSYFPNHGATITPHSTRALNQRAKRPLQGGLKSEKFLRLFPDFTFSNVDDFLSYHMGE